MNFSKKCLSKYDLGDVFTKKKTVRSIFDVRLAYKFFVGFWLVTKTRTVDDSSKKA